MTVAVSSVVGQFTSLSFFIVNMIAAMGLALGIDYSLFVVSRYREERQAGRGQGGRDRRHWRHQRQGRPVLRQLLRFVALLGLLLVPDTILRSLALGAIIVGLVTMASGRSPCCLHSCHCSATGPTRYVCPSWGVSAPAQSPFWTAAVGAVIRRPAVALTLGVLILLAAASRLYARPEHGHFGCRGTT